MDKKYSIVWKIFDKDSEIARRINAWGDISLPFFIDGEELGKLKNKESLQADEFSLLKGLLVCYFSTPPFTVTHKVKPYFKMVLEDLLMQILNQYKYDSVEQCILEMATYLKQEHDDSISYRALKTGLEILPNSLEIRKTLESLPERKD
jgi:hypothetical protein